MADFSFIQEAFGEDNEMKSLFLNSLKVELEKYEQAILTSIQQSNQEMFEETIHKFKPQAIQLGENDFVSFLGECKNKFSTNSSDGLAEKLRMKFDKLTTEIAAEIDKLST
ncbi:hypothetical protein R9C00_14565 [Flammeovirgaceae bacterium SG7u.111]|nr:hypothetical protein [Flammeovirgaceae bacterium SG7u.132]WPO38681.1 hypothetical protein R9C00_14565 [Flammeovirgaceae bacterium SG7u.111]